MKKKIQDLSDVISTAPVGRVKEDLTISTVGEQFKEPFIAAISKHILENGYIKAVDLFADLEALLRAKETPVCITALLDSTAYKEFQAKYF